MVTFNFVIKVYRNLNFFFFVWVCNRNYSIIPAKCRISFSGKTHLFGTLAATNHFIDQRTV